MTTNFNSTHNMGIKDDSTYMPNPNKRLFHDALETPYSDSSSPAKPKKKESQRYDARSMWSSDEDKLMRKILKDVKPPVNWKRVAEHFPPKNELQCQTHWEKLVNPDLYGQCKKKPWTEEEDALVIELVHKYGPQKWTFIADHLPGRIGKQCRERWHNHLNPQIKKSAWTDDEEWLLFLSHKAFGSRWAEITKNIPGRTDNSIKNHWNSSMKKKIPELSARFVRILESGGLSNPHNISDMSKLEYSLLEKIFGMTENEYHVKNENSAEAKKSKSSKNGSRNYDSKGRSKINPAPELNAYNPFNSNVKMDEISLKPASDNTTSSPNSTLDSLRKLQNNMLNNSDHVNAKLDFSPHNLDPKNPDHLHLMNQMYHPQAQGMHSVYNNAPHPNIVSTRAHFDNNTGGKQNEGNRSGQYYVKEFGIQSPAPKLETKAFGNEVSGGDQFYHGHHNNENKNTMNYSKGENLLFESPPQKKKQKFNALQSPSMADSDSMKKPNPQSIERMNKSNLSLQGFPKDYISYSGYAYSPLNLKYDSPSKMMNFCTPERGRESQLDSAGKQLFYNMNPIDKSPSLFMNKNYYSFDRPSGLKF